MRVHDAVRTLAAPDQRGAGRVDHLDNGPGSIQRLMELERHATRIWDLDLLALPGLLQVPSYSRAIIKAANSRLSEDAVYQRVSLKEKRCEWLRRQLRAEWSHLPELEFIIGERAILQIERHDPMGTKDQLRELIKVADDGRVSVRILPDHVIPPALTSMFTIYGLYSKEEGHRSLGYAETVVGGQYSTRTGDLSRLQRAWDDARSAAHSEADSLRLMREVLAKWTRRRTS